MSARSSATRTPTQLFLTGRDLWQQVYGRIGPGPGRVAAIAFLGEDAPSLLEDWGKGDLIVCDASDKTLRAGSTHPYALSEFLRRGVDVRSCGILHAKVIASPRAAVVGSMNASKNSARELTEAAIVSTDKSVIAGVFSFVEEVASGRSLRVDHDYVAKAQRIYRPSRAGGSLSRSGGHVFPRVGYREYRQMEPPKAVAAVIADQTPMVAPDSVLYMDWSWGSGRSDRTGDWAIGVVGDIVYPPALCVGVEQAHRPSKQWVTTWIERDDVPPIPRKSFEAKLLRLGHSLKMEGWTRRDGLVDALHECFDVEVQVVYDAIGWEHK